MKAKMKFKINENKIVKHLKKKRIIYLSLIIVMIVQMAIMVYYGQQKTDFHEDEYYTFGLSNDQGTGFLQIPDRTWQGPSLFAEYLTVDSNHRFDYPNVWENQANDVHPPLYYVFIHTLCSFTPEVMSKWIGISFNLVMFVLCTFVLFLTAKKLSQNEKTAWLTCVMFGFSVGAVSAVIFVRMYMLFMLLVLCAMYLILWQLERERCDRRFYLALLGISVLGILTQYYFLIFMFFLSAVFCIYLMIKRRWKEFFGYVLTMGIAGGISLLLFPSMLNHIFFGYRGTEAITNAKNTSGFISEIAQMAVTVNQGLFGGLLLELLVTCLIWIIIAGVKAKRRQEFKVKANVNRKSVLTIVLFQPWWIVFLPCIGYFLVVTKIAPFKTDRYIFPIYPLMVLLFITLCYRILRLIIVNKRNLAVLLVTIVLLVTVYGFKTQKVNYVYTDRQERHKVTREYKNLDSVYITDGEGWRVIGSCTELMNTEKVYYVDGTDTTPVEDKELNKTEELLIYVDSSFQAEDIVGKLFKDNKNLDQFELLYEGFYSKRVLCSLIYVIDSMFLLFRLQPTRSESHRKPET